MAGTSGKDASKDSVVIVDTTSKTKSRVYDVVSRILRRTKGESLEATSSEALSVPDSKSSRIKKALKRLGHKVTSLGENWNHLLTRPKNLLSLTPRQRAFLRKLTRSPETLSVGVHQMQQAGIIEYALTHADAKVVLPLSEGRDVTLVRTRPTMKSEGGITWRGEVAETGEPALLMLWKDRHLSGYLGYKGHVFMVNHMGGGVHAMAEMDPGKLPPMHPSAPQGKAGDLARGLNPATPRPASLLPAVAPISNAEREALEAKKITIDLMIVYTKNAASHYIGDPADLLALAIEETNDTFRNSGIGNISLRLVHTQGIDYDEANADHFDILYGFVDGVGLFKDLKRMREEKRADVVGLIVDDPNGCGLSTRVGAEAEEAFFVVHHSCAAITMSIAHEIGHILGARHDRTVDPNDTPLPYAHGYVNGTKWRTMMSYNEACGGCPRIPYWSNPRIMYKGEPTGTLHNDNARVILEQAERVSRFRYDRSNIITSSVSVEPKAAPAKVRRRASARVRATRLRTARTQRCPRSAQRAARRASAEFNGRFAEALLRQNCCGA